jgi:hypothetical protein
MLKILGCSCFLEPSACYRKFQPYGGPSHYMGSAAMLLSCQQALYNVVVVSVLPFCARLPPIESLPLLVVSGVWFRVQITLEFIP